jgi:Putative addiction module component
VSASSDESFVLEVLAALEQTKLEALVVGSERAWGCCLVVLRGCLPWWRGSIPVAKLTEEMLALPSEARALLADRLVESPDPLADNEVRAAWAAEAIRRRDEIRSGKAEAIPGDVVAAQVRSALRKTTDQARDSGSLLGRP